MKIILLKHDSDQAWARITRPPPPVVFHGRQDEGHMSEPERSFLRVELRRSSRSSCQASPALEWLCFDELAESSSLSEDLLLQLPLPQMSSCPFSS